MTQTHPNQKTLAMAVEPAAADADKTTVIGKVPFAGRITAVTYVPVTGITGADTDSRTVALVNKGTSGAGTTSLASSAYLSGVNATALKENALTLAAAANLAVSSGDILAWTSTHVGETGLADPGGTVLVEVTYP